MTVCLIFVRIFKSAKSSLPLEWLGLPSSIPRVQSFYWSWSNSTYYEKIWIITRLIQTQNRDGLFELAENWLLVIFRIDFRARKGSPVTYLVGRSLPCPHFLPAFAFGSTPDFESQLVWKKSSFSDFKKFQKLTFRLWATFFETNLDFLNLFVDFNFSFSIFEKWFFGRFVGMKLLNEWVDFVGLHLCSIVVYALRR